MKYLFDYADLLAWSEHANGISHETTLGLQSAVHGSTLVPSGTPGPSVCDLLREMIYNVTSAVATGHQAAAKELEQLNAHVAEVYAESPIRAPWAIASSGRGYSLCHWRPPSTLS